MELYTKQNICRACLTKKGSFKSVFLMESCLGVSMHYSEMLSACAAIQVKEGDGLPDKICSECSEQTVKLYFFKLRCEKNNIILRKSFKKCQAESVKIKNKHEDNAINYICNEDLRNIDYKCEFDEEMWEKISYGALKQENKTKNFASDICRETVDQDDLLKSQEIVKEMKVEKPEINNEDIEIKYNSISPLLMKSKESFFPCPECYYIFYEKKNLDEHISELHTKKDTEVSRREDLKKQEQLVEINSLLKDNPHGCDICFKGFSQKSVLKKHMKTHTSTTTQKGEKFAISDVVYDKKIRKSYECNMCEKKFTNSSNLSYHRRTHTGEKPYECDVCKKKFIQFAQLTRHKKIHAGEKPFECKMCDKKFTELANLNYHKIHHTGEKLYKCDVCKNRFIELDDLTKHKTIHKKPFKCEICNRKFTELTNFNCHKRVHNGEKPFECDVCNKKFAYSSIFSYHKRIHTGEKPYECNVCQKRFVQLGHLTTHKTIHTGNKPLKCEICNRKFAYSSVLMIHKRIHTGEKPYECDVCRKKFSQKNTLVGHKKIHTGEKPFECDVCHMKFSHAGNLKQHENNHNL